MANPEPIAELETRTSTARAVVDLAQDRRIRGHAVVFNSPSEILYNAKIGQFREMITPQAVDRTLKRGGSVKALWNHNDDLVLGNTRSGTLILTKNSRWLAVEVDPPKWAGPQLETIERGDVDGMSFQFRVMDGGVTWERDTKDDIPLRIVTDMEFDEVSFVPFPAYPSTSVELSQRSIRQFQEFEATIKTEWRSQWNEMEAIRMGLD